VTVLLYRSHVVLAVMGAVGTAFAGALIVVLYAGVLLVPVVVAGPVTAALVLPGVIASVVTLSRQGPTWRQIRRSPTLEWRDHPFFANLSLLPDRALLAALALLFLFLLAAGSSIIWLNDAGSPAIVDGQYFWNNHGHYTAVDRETWERAVFHQEQAVLSVLGSFGVFSTALCAATAIRAGHKGESRPADAFRRPAS
jgi:hypothetical protein